MSQAEILDLLRKKPNKEWTVKELYKKNNINIDNVRRCIRKLEEKNLIETRIVVTRIKKVKFINDGL